MTPVRVRYQTIEFGITDLHICSLFDRLQFEDKDGEAKRLGISSATWPLFGVVWPSSCVLAELMCCYKIEGRRILEVGCGIGLASLILNHRGADITATDYHPEAERFLARNVGLNHGEDIPFVRADWTKEDCGMGMFDLIVGSDLLYEEEHSEDLSNFIDRHSREQCEVIIIDPGRKQRTRFSKKMEALGYAFRRSKPEKDDYYGKPFRGEILRFLR